MQTPGGHPGLSGPSHDLAVGWEGCPDSEHMTSSRSSRPREMSEHMVRLVQLTRDAAGDPEGLLEDGLGHIHHQHTGPDDI
ncbi:hypothetical protein MC885_004351, partial [Smutsia gigantea]